MAIALGTIDYRPIVAIREWPEFHSRAVSGALYYSFVRPFYPGASLPHPRPRLTHAAALLLLSTTVYNVARRPTGSDCTWLVAVAWMLLAMDYGAASGWCGMFASWSGFTPAMIFELELRTTAVWTLAAPLAVTFLWACARRWRRDSVPIACRVSLLAIALGVANLVAILAFQILLIGFVPML
ncbi:MAG: hypothetical protein KDA41_20445 [Planctomycetales bacterium]|nr:hypothetical protein [Planctomycetales bacterium]